MESIKRLLPILAVLFLGALGFSLTLPLFPPLFFDHAIDFLPEQTDDNVRHILLGILFAMYPLGQFIGAPILGKYSDRYGRRPVLLLSLLATIPGYAGSALAVMYQMPALLFFTRFFCGLLEGNIVIAQAAISDVSKTSQNKTKNFGLLVTLSSSAFIFGPLIGGKLADPSIVSWFHYETPFWGTTLLVIVGFFVVFALMKETHGGNLNIHIKWKKISRSFTEGLKYEALRPIFLFNLCIFTAMFFFFNFFCAYLVNRFNFNTSRLGEVNAYLAIFLIVTPLFFGKLSARFTAPAILKYGCFLLAVSYIAFILPNTPIALIGTLIPIGCVMALGFTFPAILISDHAPLRARGQALGTNTSIQVFAEGLTALSGGFLMALFSRLPILVGALFALLGGLLLWRYKKRHSLALTHEKNVDDEA